MCKACAKNNYGSYLENECDKVTLLTVILAKVSE